MHRHAVESASLALECPLSAPPLLLSTADSRADSAAACERRGWWTRGGGKQQFSSALRFKAGRRPQPCRFGSITLGGFLDHLPKFKQRGPLYDPWDPTAPEAPRGVSGTRRQPLYDAPAGELAVRASLASGGSPQGAAPQAAAVPARSRAAPANSPPEAPQRQHHPLPHGQQQDARSVPQAQAQQQRQPVHGHDAAPPRQAGGPTAPLQQPWPRSEQPPKGPGEWLAGLLPKLPGSPSDLRNRLGATPQRTSAYLQRPPHTNQRMRWVAQHHFEPQ